MTTFSFLEFNPFRFQIRHEDFRQRIAVEDEDITRFDFSQSRILIETSFAASLTGTNWQTLCFWTISRRFHFLLFWISLPYAGKKEIHTFTFLSLQDIKRTNSSAVWRYLIGTTTIWMKSKPFVSGYKNLLRAIENLGIAVVYGIRYLYVLFIQILNALQILWPRKHHGGQLYPVHQAWHPELWISEPVKKLCCLRQRELWDPQEPGLWVLDLAEQSRAGNLNL